MREGKPPLVVLTGPTAVGKTRLSIELAKAIGGEIISADSMQVYRGMDIGSAKIRPDEMQGIPHYLVDVLEPEEDFHVVRFARMAREAMGQIYSHGHIPILVGGTGFYIQAVTRDIDFTEAGQEDSYRRELERFAAEKGAGALHLVLRQVDPLSAERIHENNVKRVIRALEYYHQNSRPISAHNEEQRAKDSPYHLAYFVLTAPRELLYRRIDARVDEMMEQGLAEEVMRLKKRGCHRGMTSMQALGYKEILDALDGLCTMEEAVRILKRDTRHFAKRQLTWFRREEEVIWLDQEDYGYDEDRILKAMIRILNEEHINAQQSAE
ncbi:MAG: tRNA (adenosine(37)-N6)-dimethylallyltransferase MiaA [Blautia sp.]|nr:tRNA (adenosine(37)-N6)-dimethylallyltransferase MiaA [Blautia sp.]